MADVVKTRIKNGVEQKLQIRSASIIFNDGDRKDVLNTSMVTNITDQQNGLLRLPRSTLLIGDNLYNDVWHPNEELEKSYTTLENQPFVIDHKDDIEDEVGFMQNVQYDAETKKLSAIPVLNMHTAKGMSALNHIRNRVMAGKAPETSVGFWATERKEKIKQLQDEEHITARDWEFDHNSLVSRGAGTPAMGIGIGLSQAQYPKTESKREIPVDLKISIDTKEIDDTLIKMKQLKKETAKMDEPKTEIKNEAKPEVQPFMTRDEFRAEIKAELSKKETELKDKSTEMDAMKKKISDLEASISSRTTATRDSMTTARPMVMDAKAKELRRRIIGSGIIQYLKEGEGDLHIHLAREKTLEEGL